MTFLKSVLVATLAWMPLQAQAETYLLMAEEMGCYWCARWDEEVAHKYPKTDEGRAAPLRRYDLHSETPDVLFDRRVSYTPTFILVQDGAEQGRIEGYPGEDFFWGLLQILLRDADVKIEKTG